MCVSVFVFFLGVMGGGVEGDALVLFMQGNVLCLTWVTVQCIVIIIIV